MSAWWIQTKAAKQEADPKRRTVDYYRHSAENCPAVLCRARQLLADRHSVDSNP